MKLFHKKSWQDRGMEIINSHFGKKLVYENYLQNNPILAEKYLRFISRNVQAVYISFDEKQQRFV